MTVLEKIGWRLLTLAVALSFGSLAGQEQPEVLLAHAGCSRGCVGSTGPPSVSFSPNNRVINILLSNFVANVQPKTGSLKQQSDAKLCRVQFDAQIPGGYRAVFKGAQYAYSAIAIGSSSSCDIALRHGTRRWLFTQWTEPFIISSTPESMVTDQKLVAPLGGALRSGCGSKIRLVMELKLRASAGRIGDVARSEVDSIGFDSEIADQLTVEPCGGPLPQPTK